jgi:hypothetical protein
MPGGRDDQDARDLSTVKVKISKELWPIRSACGSEGNLLTHPGKVPITLTGDHLAFSKANTTLSKGVRGDDPPTMQDIQQLKSGEDHLEKTYDGVSLRLRLTSDARCAGGIPLRPCHLMGACCGGVSLRPRHQMGAYCGVSSRPRHQMGAFVLIRSSRALRTLDWEERIVGWPGEAGTGSSVSAPV